MAAVERILVIKLGALGDFVLATGPFKALRQAHPGARIVLLTTAPYAEMARTAPFFDEVWGRFAPAPLAARPRAGAATTVAPGKFRAGL